MLLPPTHQIRPSSRSFEFDPSAGASDILALLASFLRALGLSFEILSEDVPERGSTPWKSTISRL